MADQFPFFLNGKSYDRAALTNWGTTTLQDESTSSWEKELAHFIGEWLSEASTVTVNTSGSTGAPKQIQLPKAAMRRSAEMTGTHFSLGKDTSALLCLPVRFIAGKMMVVRALTLGWKLWAVSPGSHPLQNLEQQVDFTAMVPLQLASTLEVATEKARLQNIDQIIIGGGAVSPQLEQKIQQEKNRYFVTYGMTETITHIATRPMNGPEQTDLYTVLEGVELSQGENGALHIRAAHLGDAPIETTDLVALENRQQFRWLGRADNVLISGGIKVIPEVVEGQLKALTNASVLLIGLKDEKLGERLELLIESAPWTTEVLAQFHQQMRETLSPYEVPKAVHFLPSFERTENGKVQRMGTRNRFLESI